VEHIYFTRVVQQVQGKPLKVMIVSPSNTIGGAELSLLENVKYLHKNNVKIVAVLPPDEKNQLGRLLEPYCEKVYHQHFMRWIWNFSEHENWKDKLIGFAYYFKLSGGYFPSARKIAAIGKTHQVQLVHTNASAVIDGALAAKKMNVPHIYHVREIMGNSKNAIVSYPFQAVPAVFKWLMTYLHREVVFNSAFCMQAAQQYFNQHHATVIHNGFHPTWFVLPSSKTKEHRVGIIANVTSSAKNHLFALQTALVLNKSYLNNNVEFHLYGGLPGTENTYLQMLKEFIKVNKLEQKIIFKGSVSSEKIYEQIDVLLHPTFNESFGRVFIEAMGKGVPVVAVASGGAKELIRHGRTGFLVEANEQGKAADYIMELLYDEDTYKKMQQEAFRYAAENFSIEQTGRDLLHMYRNLIENKGAVSAA
jgi:glycosyltransferase involved in cell wall biosynthesis